MNLLNEIKVFLSHPRNMRVLLLANFIFALVIPIVDLFVVAYVMRSSHNNMRVVMIYQVAMFTGMPVTFFLNSLFLRLLDIKYLFSIGILLCPVAMATIMAMPEVAIGGLVGSGLMMGAAFGIYWANRDILTLNCTDDENRNYYYSMNTVFATLCGLVVPVSVGWFITCSAQYGWFGSGTTPAYRVLTVLALLLAGLSSWIICRGRFVNPPRTRFVYFRYHPMWYRVMALSSLRGLSQIFNSPIPVMLVALLLGGKEGVLGTLQTGGTAVTVIGMYLIGRLTRTGHRLGLMMTGLGLFLFAAISNAVLFNVAGVIIYVFFQMLGNPIVENTVLLVQMRAINVLEKKERRNILAYLFSVEFSMWAGRLFGGLLFIAVVTFSEILALRYVLLAIASLQACAYLFGKNILRTCDRLDAEAAAPLSQTPSINF
ncbi:MAG: hypothetical protein LBK71_03605 [Verrucomicrobiales bacterium]|jgi:YQGE family putative transporter|nr:hypothetical protein [Verrucomicrobiales bacterium]